MLCILLVLLHSHIFSAQQCEHKIKALDAEETEFAPKAHSVLEAAQQGDFAAAVQLAQPKTIDQKNAAGNTAFSEAVFYGHEKIAQFLLSYGANVNTQNTIGDTPLLRAAAKKDIAMIRFLLKNNANPLIKNNKNRTARAVISLEGSKEGRELLGAAEKLWLDNTNALYDAIYYNNQVAFSETLKAGKLLERISNDSIAIFMAASSSNPFFLQQLIQAGFNPRITNDSGQQPMHMVLRSCYQQSMPEKIRLLLQAGVEFDTAARTAMNQYCTTAHKQAIEALLDEKQQRQERIELQRARRLKQDLINLHNHLATLAQALG